MTAPELTGDFAQALSDMNLDVRAIPDPVITASTALQTDDGFGKLDQWIGPNEVQPSGNTKEVHIAPDSPNKLHAALASFLFSSLPEESGNSTSSKVTPVNLVGLHHKL